MRRRRARPVRRAGICAAILATAVAADALALDLSSDNVGRDATPSFQQNVQRWDIAGQLGASSVSERSRQPYQPDGLRAGNFIVFPSLGATVLFDDNVYATSANRRSDIRVEVLPSVRVVSELPRHVLDFAVGAKLASYARHHDLDANDVYGTVSGTLHFDHAHTLSASLLTSLEHDSAMLPESPLNARERTPIWHNRASLGLRRDAGRLYGSIGLTAESWDFQNVSAWDGSRIDQDYRDLRVFSSRAMLGYRFSPGFEWQGKVRALRQVNRGNAAFDADAYGYEGLTGLSFQTSPVLRYRVLGGYGIRDWDRPGMATTGTGLAEGEVMWLATQSLTTTLTARRSFSESATEDSDAGAIETSISAKLEYEAWRNLLFTFGGEYRNAELIGQGRRDQSYIARAGLEYYLTKNWQLSVGLEHLERQSNVDAFDLTRNKIWFGAKLKF